MDTSTYLPATIQRPSILERYYQWESIETTSEKNPGKTEDKPNDLRILRKKQGPFIRYIVIGESAAQNIESDQLKSILSHASAIHYHVLKMQSSDFENQNSIHLAGRELKPAAPGERIFHLHTLIHDLRESENVILDKFKTQATRTIKKAEKENIKVTIQHKPNEEMLLEFLSYFSIMADKRGLQVPQLNILKTMVTDGSLWIAITTSQEGETLGIQLIYLNQKIGSFLHGASNPNNQPNNQNDYGHFTHWEIMKELKRQGFHWYDLEGVATVDMDNGIYRFKQSLGGLLVGPSMEWIWYSKIYSIARRLKNFLNYFGRFFGKLIGKFK